VLHCFSLDAPSRVSEVNICNECLGISVPQSEVAHRNATTRPWWDYVLWREPPEDLIYMTWYRFSDKKPCDHWLYTNVILHKFLNVT
jgi:hypothetical protein